MGIAPTGPIVTVAGHEHIQERIRVVVVANPARTACIESNFGLIRQIYLPFDLSQFHLYAQLITPHLLHLHRNFRMYFGGTTRRSIEHVLKSRESPAPWITSFRQQFPRLLRVISQPFGRMVTGNARRSIILRWLLPGL